MFVTQAAEALKLKKFLFWNAEILEEDAPATGTDDDDDDIDLTDDDDDTNDKGDSKKTDPATVQDEKDKRIAELEAKNKKLGMKVKNVTKEKKNLEANGYLDDEKTEKILDQRARLKEYKEEYPDLDVEAVKDLARNKWLTIDEAVRIIKFDDVRKTAPKISLWGRTSVSTDKTQYTRQELKDASPAEYGKISDAIKSGKAKLID